MTTSGAKDVDDTQAWILLDELPRPIQLFGGLLILVGVIGVKLGEVDHQAGADPGLMLLPLEPGHEIGPREKMD